MSSSLADLKAKRELWNGVFDRRGQIKEWGKMKLSVEAKVAAAIATAFVALTVGAIAQGNAAGQIGSPDGYGSVNAPGFNTQMKEQGYNSSLGGGKNR
jgi:hypothetical protein